MVETGEEIQVEPSTMYFDMPILFLRRKEALFFIPQEIQHSKTVFLDFLEINSS